MDASAAYLALTKENASMQSRLDELNQKVDGLEKELEEQCRIIGMSAERELSMVAKMEQLGKDRRKYQNTLVGREATGQSLGQSG